MNKPISGTTSFLMLFTAGLFDVIQALVNLIPVAGQIINRLISIFAFLTFWLWFKIHGMSFSKGKNIGTLGAGFIIELIPLVDILPAWTFAVFRLISMSKIQKITAKISVIDKNKNLVSGNNIQKEDFSLKKVGQPDNGKVVSIDSKNKKTKKDGDINKNQIYYSDVLDELNKKRNPTPSDIKKLERAESIMRNHSISPQEMNDPVYLAAWNKVQAGIEVFDGTNNGYKFNKNTQIAA